MGLGQKFLRGAYYRGGTSRALIVERAQLPADETKWPRIFLQILGSPDPYGRQLDGIGGGISSLSKVCVVSSPSVHRPADADVDYTFYAVGIREEEVDASGNCGNMSAAIGPYVYEHELVAKPQMLQDKQKARVRIFNTNTKKIICSTFQTAHDQARVDGNFVIDGVSGSGSRVSLDFERPGGAKTGKTLPTGSPIDRIDGVSVSCIDVGNPCVFVDASRLGVTPETHPPDAIQQDTQLMNKLETLRRAAAVRMGLVEIESDTPRAIPKVGLVSASTSYRLLSGNMQDTKEVDVIIQFMSDRQPHRAIPLTAAVCSGAAAGLRGSLVHSMLSAKRVQDGTIWIGHTSGRIPTMTQLDREGEIESVTVFRTARRLIEGDFYYRAEA